MDLFNWPLGGYLVFIAALISVAYCVALFGVRKSRRECGLKVLRLLLDSTAGTSGIAMLVFKLHAFGLQ
jgi:hypothetical protein